MTQARARCFKRNDDIICKEIDGELCLVDPYRRVLLRINPAGLLIWRLLDGTHAIVDIVAVFQEKYECRAFDAQRDVAAFISELEKRELVA